MWSRRFRALTITVEISADSDALVEALEAITGSYPASSEPAALRYEVQDKSNSFRILRQGKVLDEGTSAIDVPSVLELDMLRSCVVEAVDSVVLHAAALTIGEATLVMAGPSGAGKTTLTRALLHTGARYRSDECVAIGGDDKVQGLARPIHLEDIVDTSIDASRVHQHLWLDDNDNVVCDRLWHPPPAEEIMPAGALKSLVLVSYVPHAPATRVALTTGEALTRIWPCVLNPGPRTLDLLTEIVERRPVFAIESPSVADGCTLVRRGLS